jgi:hypothetical protein
MRFLNEPERLAFNLLSDNLPVIIDDAIRPARHRKWRDEGKSTRLMFRDMSIIEPYMNNEEVSLFIEQFFEPDHRSIDIRSLRCLFICDSNAIASLGPGPTPMCRVSHRECF